MREVVGARRLAALLAVAALVGWACHEAPTAPGCGTISGQAPARGLVPLSLAPGQYALVQGFSDIELPATTSQGATYLAVGQLATPNADLCGAFSLRSGAAPSLLVAGTGAAVPPAVRFHDMLRLREAQAARGGALLLPLLRARTPPPAPGDTRTFKVCANIDCSSLASVAATARFVGAHLAIFVDDSAPSGGFTAGDLTDIGQMFDGVLYPIDTGRFGAESDIDGNGVVLVLLTARVNALIGKPQCTTSFVTGYFYGLDLAPGVSSQYNNGEVFYGMVPDPTGTVTCSYSTTFVKHVIPVTFIHEFQHMISFNQHVLVRGGASEILWLNEAMSHLAEELGGLHYDSAGVDTTASRFFVGDLFNAYGYLTNPTGVAMVTEASPGGLDQRGAGWLFLRYVVDQFGPATTTTLEQTTLTGAVNIEHATGLSFSTLLGREALALYLADLPGFAAPPELTFSHWAFRSQFASLHQQDPQDFPLAFPLAPDSGLAGQAGSTGTLASGSGAWLVLSQPAGAPPFVLSLGDAGGQALPLVAGAQVAMARIR